MFKPKLQTISSVTKSKTPENCQFIHIIENDDFWYLNANYSKRRY